MTEVFSGDRDAALGFVTQTPQVGGGNASGRFQSPRAVLRMLAALPKPSAVASVDRQAARFFGGTSLDFVPQAR